MLGLYQKWCQLTDRQDGWGTGDPTGTLTGGAWWERLRIPKKKEPNGLVTFSTWWPDLVLKDKCYEDRGIKRVTRGWGLCIGMTEFASLKCPLGLNVTS